ncbi:MAG: carboxypeptidase regulatory-like domain-containing protein [Deltaproteobacteria bacterium]|nr:carboxypeptidase regulatory-like domain-containing protein [Deltaproteobacteria bacterium]
MKIRKCYIINAAITVTAVFILAAFQGCDSESSYWKKQFNALAHSSYNGQLVKSLESTYFDISEYSESQKIQDFDVLIIDGDFHSVETLSSNELLIDEALRESVPILFVDLTEEQVAHIGQHIKFKTEGDHAGYLVDLVTDKAPRDHLNVMSWKQFDHGNPGYNEKLWRSIDDIISYLEAKKHTRENTAVARSNNKSDDDDTKSFDIETGTPPDNVYIPRVTFTPDPDDQQAYWYADWEGDQRYWVKPPLDVYTHEFRVILQLFTIYDGTPNDEQYKVMSIADVYAFIDQYHNYYKTNQPLSGWKYGLIQQSIHFMNYFGSGIEYSQLSPDTVNNETTYHISHSIGFKLKASKSDGPGAEISYNATKEQDVTITDWTASNVSSNSYIPTWDFHRTDKKCHLWKNMPDMSTKNGKLRATAVYLPGEDHLNSNNRQITLNMSYNRRLQWVADWWMGNCCYDDFIWAYDNPNPNNELKYTDLPTCTIEIPRLFTGYIYGAVLDADTYEQIQGATVTAGAYQDATNSTGHYTLSNITEGTGFTVTASKDGYQPGSVTVDVIAGKYTSADNILLKKTQ